jgi:hypothetical protein
MIRAGDVFYPSQYPPQMSESLGVDTSEVPPGHGGAPTYPSQSLINRTYTPAPATPRNGSAPAFPIPHTPPPAAAAPADPSARGDANSDRDDSPPPSRPAGRPTWVTAETARPSDGLERRASNGLGGGSLSVRRESLSRLRESSLRDERG